MKRLSLILTVLSAVLLSACRDNSYLGYQLSMAELQARQSVRVAVGDPSSSKGSGSVMSIEDFEGKEIYIWAFNRDNLDFRSTESTPGNLCLIDGYPAVLDGKSSIPLWRDGRNYFYPNKENSTLKYDFWAAYLDLGGSGMDKNKIKRTASSIEYSMSIDGSQDIMLSKAKTPSGKEDYAFSYVSALEGDIPIFTMQHQLVRFDFLLLPGITEDLTRDVQVDGAEMTSQTEAVATLVSADWNEIGLGFVGPEKRLTLKDKGGKDFEPIRLQMIKGIPGSEDAINRQWASRMEFGGGMFVAPQQEYSLFLKLFDMVYTTGPTERNPVIEHHVRLASGNSFLAGNRYGVTITVYGARVISVNVQMIPWNSSGSFVIDRMFEGELLDLNVTASDLTLAVGQVAALEPKIMVAQNGVLVPAEVPGVQFSYTALDPSVASVNAAGNVTAHATGTAWIEIEATRQGISDAYGHCVVKIEVI